MTLSLVTSDFVKDGEVSSAVFNTELVSDLSQKRHLILTKLLVNCHVIHFNDGPVLLDPRIDEQGVEFVSSSTGWIGQA